MGWGWGHASPGSLALRECSCGLLLSKGSGSPNQIQVFPWILKLQQLDNTIIVTHLETNHT